MEIKITHNIDKVRVEQKISKKQLTKLVDLDYSAVSRLLNNEYASLKVSTLVKYAIALNCDVKDLFNEVKTL